MLAGEALDAREAGLLDDLAASHSHVDQMLDAAARDAAALRGRLRPVLAVFLFEHAGWTEHAIRHRDHEVAGLARQVAIDQREPPDLGAVGLARDAQRELRLPGGAPCGRKNIRMSADVDPDRTEARFRPRCLAPTRIEFEIAG